VGVVRSRDSHEISLGVSELLARTGVVEEEPEKLADAFCRRPESPTGSAPGSRLARSTASVDVNKSPGLRSSTHTLPGSRLCDESERRIGLDVAPRQP
jgi:hypothetical protein